MDEVRELTARLIALRFETAIKEGRCTPADRERFMKRYRDGGSEADAVAWIATSQPQSPALRRVVTLDPAAAAEFDGDAALRFDVESGHGLLRAARAYREAHEVEHGARLPLYSCMRAVVAERFQRDAVAAADWRTANGQV